MKNAILITSIFLSFNVVAQVPSYLPTNGLVGWYSFTGNANDGSGNGNNGVVSGATLNSDRFGNSNSAFSFNGANSDYIEIPDNAMFQSPAATWSIWVKISTPSGGNGYGIMSKGSDLTSFFMIEEYQNNLGAQITWQPGLGIGNQSSINILDGTWHNVTATYDNSISSDNFLVYLDGVLQGAANYNNDIFSLNNGLPIRIGRSIDPYWQSFTGLVDDIGIWNRALAASEINSIYQGCAFAIQPSNQNSNVGSSAQFIATLSDPNATFQWQSDLGFGFQNLSNAGQYAGTTNDTLTISNLTISNNNQAFRCILSSMGCKDTSNVVILTVNSSTAVNSLLDQGYCSVYPNPTNAILTVQVDSKLIGKNYSIIDQLGKIILEGNLGGETTKVDLLKITSGKYHFIIEGYEKHSFAFIKM